MGKIREVGGRKVGIVQFNLAELMDHEPAAIQEPMSVRLVGDVRFVDLAYEVVGRVENLIYFEVSGVEESPTAPDEVLSRVAAGRFGVEILETRNSDRLDFHDLGVATIREVLAAAYEAGKLAAAGLRYRHKVGR